MNNKPVEKDGTIVGVHLVPVESSNIKAVGYDADSQRLLVEFLGGGTYCYAGVPPEIHAAFMAAPSLGRYLHQHIKPLYTVTKLMPKPGEGG